MNNPNKFYNSVYCFLAVVCALLSLALFIDLIFLGLCGRAFLVALISVLSAICWYSIGNSEDLIEDEKIEELKETLKDHINYKLENKINDEVDYIIDEFFNGDLFDDNKKDED